MGGGGFQGTAEFRGYTVRTITQQFNWRKFEPTGHVKDILKIPLLSLDISYLAPNMSFFAKWVPCRIFIRNTRVVPGGSPCKSMRDDIQNVQHLKLSKKQIITGTHLRIKSVLTGIYLIPYTLGVAIPYALQKLQVFVIC